MLLPQFYYSASKKIFLKVMFQVCNRVIDLKNIYLGKNSLIASIVSLATLVSTRVAFLIITNRGFNKTE